MAHVDWLSYTIQTQPLADFTHSTAWLSHCCESVPAYLGFDRTMIGTARRAGAMTGADIGKHTYVWFIKSGYVLVEHTGKGCEYLRQEGLLNDLLANVADAVSRVDLAIDYDTDAQPESVAQQRDTARQSARSSMVSSTGATEYVGSRHSDRYMRIYRYAPPHPRAQYLRLEYVLKKDYARAAAAALASGTTPAALASGQRQHYGLTADFILAEETEAHSLSVDWETRSAGKTVRWLYGPVASSMKKLMQSGDFDLDEFLAFLAR